MKAILMSIKPKRCEKIFSGEEKIYVRKTAPKETPFKVYVYCTSIKNMSLYDYVEMLAKTVGIIDDWSGKVIGEFVCDRVKEYRFSNYEARYNINDVDLMATCLNHPDLIQYGKGKTLCGLHITEAKLYDKPKDLEVFWSVKCTNKTGDCEKCEAKPACINNITRPPKSWCYLGEVGE